MVKTAVAVFICLVIAWLRDSTASPVMSMITAVICVQPYSGDTKRMVGIRLRGTVIGLGLGLLMMVLYQYVLIGLPIMLWFVIDSLGVIAVLYIMLCIRHTEASCLAVIEYLIVTVSYLDSANAVAQASGRAVNVFIGAIVATLVNMCHLPGRQHRDTLCLLDVETLLDGEGKSLASSAKVLLNRYIEEGAKVSFFTWRVPAFLLDKLSVLKISCPVMVMDGAALYDIEDNEYLDKSVIPSERVALLENFLVLRGFTFFTCCIRDNTLLIYYTKFGCAAEEKNYQKMHKSPYRNYIKGHFGEGDEVMYLRVLDEASKVDRLLSDFEESALVKYFRPLLKELPEYEGCKLLYFYDVRSDKAEMIKKMMRYTQTDSVEVIGPRELPEVTVAASSAEEAVRAVRRI